MKEKNLSYYLSLNYPITITKDIDEGKIYFEAEIPDLPGCSVYGGTIEEALINLEEAKKLWFKVSLKKGVSIPEPALEDVFSGRFLLRIPARLHRQLTLKAKKEGISLNQYIRKNLEIAVTLDSVLKKMEELSQEVKQLSGKVSRVPEADIVEWREQPSQPADKIIFTGGVVDFGIWSNAGCVSSACAFWKKEKYRFNKNIA